MGDAARFFRRSSGQMKAVVAEAAEVLEATREVIAKLESDPPAALSDPPPDLVWAERDGYPEKSPTSYRATVAREENSETTSHVRTVSPKAPRPPAVKPLPPPLPRKK